MRTEPYPSFRNVMSATLAANKLRVMQVLWAVSFDGSFSSLAGY